MNRSNILALSALTAALLAGCSTVPAGNMQLEQARIDYRAAQDNPQARTLAATELKQAGDAIDRATTAWSRGDATPDVNHLAYLARQRVAIAQETARQKEAERAVGNADMARGQVRLEARTNEADAAQRSAEAARAQSDAARLDAEAAQRQAQEAQRQAQTAQRQNEASQQQTADAQARAALLEAQLRELDARQTERGLVITIGDLLFDTDRSELRPGAQANIMTLSSLLQQYPQRIVRIEGFTDSTGSDSYNQDLSSRRADSVRNALVGRGVDSTRISTQGFGKAWPVADNSNASGRQLNRRVEIILSDDSGVIAQR